MPCTFFRSMKLVISADACANLAREVKGLPTGRAVFVTDSGRLRAGVEAHLRQRNNASTALVALAALHAIVRWLPRAVARGDDSQQRAGSHRHGPPRHIGDCPVAPH
jgi:alcohol dehydrogenase class IV